MTKEEIKALIQKYNDGNCTRDEKGQLESWYIYTANENKDLSFSQDLWLNKEARYQDILSSKESKATILTLLFHKYRNITIAAITFIAVSVPIYLAENWSFDKAEAITVFKNDISPGGNKAFLTLSNGKRINLTEAKTGELATQLGIEITKDPNGQVIYRSHSTSTTNTQKAKSENLYNIIETPRGGQYLVCLPDGSKVWLNAASTLKFPITFADASQRKVELSGEAYFEVSKDKVHPFIVKTKAQDVEVLGTVFNISSYKDDERTKTTLINGSVKITSLNKSANKSPDKTNQKILIPGQEALLTYNSLVVSNANLKEATAWKNGYFILNHDNFREIMSKISRWYDVEIIYQCDPDGLRLGGMVPRSEKISTILELIGKISKVHFKIEGRRVTVIE